MSAGSRCPEGADFVMSREASSPLPRSTGPDGLLEQALGLRRIARAAFAENNHFCELRCRFRPLSRHQARMTECRELREPPAGPAEANVFCGRNRQALVKEISPRRS